MSQIMSQLMLEDCDSHVVGVVEQALANGEVFFLRDSKPVAKIVPLSEDQPASHFGNAKEDLIYMADDFDAPMEDFEDYT